MKSIGLKEAKAHLSEFIDEAQRDRILITRRGKPAALVIGVEGQDLEQVILGSDAEFWRTIQERRKQKATLTSDDIRRFFGTSAEHRRPASAERKQDQQRRRVPRGKR